MTIERVDSFSQSREKGVSLFDAIRGKRTATQVHPDQVVWTDGRITHRFTSVKPEDREKFSNGALVTGSGSITLLAFPGTRTRVDFILI